MKKNLIVIICLVMVISLLSACAKQQTTDSTPVAATNTQEGSAKTDNTQTVTVPTGNSADTKKAVSTGQTKEMNIEMFNFGFNQDPTLIKVGDHVILHVKSTEGNHGIMIPGLGLSTHAIAEGDSQTIEFDAKDAGSFQYFCNVPCGPGHKSMRGQIVVEP